MGTNAVQQGNASRNVSANLRWLRGVLGLSLSELTTRSAYYGRQLDKGALHRMEKGARRIDVDDLEVLGQILGLDGERVHLLMHPPERLTAVYRDELIRAMRREFDAMDPSNLAAAPLRDHLRRWEDWASRESTGAPDKGQERAHREG